MNRIQSTAGYSLELGYSVSICFGEGPLVSLEGLEHEEIRHLLDMLICLLWGPLEDAQKDWPDGTDY